VAKEALEIRRRLIFYATAADSAANCAASRVLPGRLAMQPPDRQPRAAVTSSVHSHEVVAAASERDDCAASVEHPAEQLSQPSRAGGRFMLPVREQVQRKSVVEHVNVGADHPVGEPLTAVAF
jgi:hypothetical protein